MIIRDAEYELESDPDFITSRKINGTKVVYLGPKITGYETPGLGGLLENLITIGGSTLIDLATEGYYPEDSNTNNIVSFYISRKYHGRLYRSDIK